MEGERSERALILMSFHKTSCPKSALHPNDFWSRARQFCGTPKLNKKVERRNATVVSGEFTQYFQCQSIITTPLEGYSRNRT